MDKECTEELDKLQTLFLSLLLAVPLTCARPALAWDTKTLSMDNRISMRKLNLCVHLKKLDKDDLAKQVYEEQVKNGYPGLARETQDLCEYFCIPDITKERLKEPSKAQWKKIIKEAVEKKNGMELKEKILKMEKLEVMKNESYGLKDYLSDLSLEDARMLFRVRTKTLKCKMNQSRHNRESLWKCKACGCIESQSHIMHCPAYQQLREGKSLENDEDLAIYFREVLKLRDQLNV